MVADSGRLDARRAVAVAAVICALVAAVALDAHSVSAAGPAENGPIAFVSDRDGDPDIYLVDPSDGGIERVTDNQSWDTDPVWSPDGTRLAISSDRDGDDDIYVLDAMGTGSAVNLTDGDSSRDTQPDWSPSGRKVVFVRDGDIYVVTAAGGAPLRLVRGHDPAWSPDGSKIAFVRSNDIFMMSSDGTNVDVLVQEAGPFGVDWSPDGTRLVFASNSLSDDGGFHIYVVGVNGSGLQALTSDGIAEDFSPAFSPDGTRVVFTRIAVDADLMTVGADGTGVAPVVQDPAYDFEGHWGPCTSGCASPTPTATGSPSPDPAPTPTVTPTGDPESSSLTVSVIKGRDRVKAAGRLRPPHEGSVIVKLQKRKGRWVTLTVKEVPLDAAGGYRTRFKRPRRGTACRVVARWAGDADHLPSSARDRFRC